LFFFTFLFCKSSCTKIPKKSICSDLTKQYPLESLTNQGDPNGGIEMEEVSFIADDNI
jgi:hypothetical protein